MKFTTLLSVLLLFIGFTSCKSEPLKEGKIVYAIDYPDQKDNFFLYSILPKEMELFFKDGRMHSSIKKANLINSLYVDCNKKQVAAYFNYGTEAYNVTLIENEIKAMLAVQKKYKISYLNETDTIAGYDVKKALATSETDPRDKIELWYTEDISINNPNWYNPFHEVPGVLLAYSIDRYGIRMVFKAKSVEEIAVEEALLEPSKNGKSISYIDYDSKLADLFKTFE